MPTEFDTLTDLISGREFVSYSAFKRAIRLARIVSAKTGYDTQDILDAASR